MYVSKPVPQTSHHAPIEPEPLPRVWDEEDVLEFLGPVDLVQVENMVLTSQVDQVTLHLINNVEMYSSKFDHD